MSLSFPPVPQTQLSIKVSILLPPLVKPALSWSCCNESGGIETGQSGRAMWEQGGVMALFVSLLWAHTAAIEVPQDLKQPPTIVKQSVKDYIVDPRTTCHRVFMAENGKFFNIVKDFRVIMRKRSGTLEIAFRSGDRPEDYEERVPVFRMAPIEQDQRVSMGLNGDLYFSHVMSRDAQTDYSCNARFLFTIQQKNPYYLKVHTSRQVPESTPSFLSPLGTESSKTVLRDQHLLLECIAAGRPTPTISWFKKGGELPERKVTLENFNKTLRVSSVSEEDAGEYVCMATNRLGSIRHSISVHVKAAPYWLDKPTNLVLAPDENGRLVCRANGNPKPNIEWLVNGQPLNSSLPSQGRQLLGDTILFRSVQMGSSAVYQCNASNPHGYLLANAFVSVLDMPPRMLAPKNQLIKVIENNRTFLDCPFLARLCQTCAERPDPPTDLELSDLAARSVRLTWIPGQDNHSPVLEFLVQFEEDLYEPGVWRNLSSYPGDHNSVILQLAPFVNYHFRVIAINSVGQSEPSRPSPRYKTSGTAPDTIPRGLRGWGSSKDNMEISWEPLSDLERNGPDLHYSVWWRLSDSEGEWSNITTTASRQVVTNTNSYTAYDIKIQARNSFGHGPQSNVVVGYSGEDVPEAAPTNLKVYKVDSSKAHLQWTAVNMSTVHGQFKEYRLYFWRESSQVPDLVVNKEKQTKGFFSTAPEPSAVLTDLQPFSHYHMYMVVANSRYEGPKSNTVRFSTKEGVPEAPSFFRINRKGLDTLLLQWDKPLEPNGILIGYQLKYIPVNGSRGGRPLVETFLPNVTEFVLRLPDRMTRYKLFLSARTQVGAGQVIAEEAPLFTNEAYMDQVDIATQGWFIGLMCAIALIILILLIVCFIKRSRGGKYPEGSEFSLTINIMYKRILLLYRDPESHDMHTNLKTKITKTCTKFENHLDLEECSFIFFVSDEDNKPLQGSQTSLDANVKESDDSLVDYGEGGDGQFNEDGSFIGQYTVKKDKDETEGNESSEATSPVNAIYSLA
ncbi:hypothetical protein WMY93_012532 [Mugilogobius chulae]|uniref:Neural cell adhesion molecule L1 n=1 Tax=Mugilogobius chulae TaxID=88201 RepID=A0AAW0PH22_9GOBI